MNFIYFFSTVFVSLVISFIVYKLCLKYKLNDIPNENRKIHKEPTPNMGGIAMFFSFWIVMVIFTFANRIEGAYFKYIIGLLIGSSLLFVIGLIDDRKRLSPKIKFLAQIFSALIIIASGVGITFINNPFGGFIFLDQIKIPLHLFGSIYNITLLADIFALLWIVGMINVVNFLDGLDGLAGGVSALSFICIFLLSITPGIEQPLSAIIALVMAGAIIGFLPLNLNPARMFMGDTGSMFLGFMLATIAIISGGKVATALLVLGLPIFDGLWVAISRIIKGHRPWEADRNHFHHKLLELGLSKRWVVYIFWFITALFGSISLFQSSKIKFISIVILFILLFLSRSLIDIAANKRKLSR